MIWLPVRREFAGVAAPCVSQRCWSGPVAASHCSPRRVSSQALHVPNSRVAPQCVCVCLLLGVRVLASARPAGIPVARSIHSSLRLGRGRTTAGGFAAAAKVIAVAGTRRHTHTHLTRETRRNVRRRGCWARRQCSASSACRHGDAGRPDGRPFRTDSRTDRVATAAGGGFAAAVRVAAVRDVCRVDRVMFNQVELSARSNAV